MRAFTKTALRAIAGEERKAELGRGLSLGRRRKAAGRVFEGGG